jgi:hypothetical protein
MPLEEQQMIFGYLDPGSGSLLLQAVIGGATGLTVAVKAFRHRYRWRRGEDAPDTGEENAEDAAEDAALHTES